MKKILRLLILTVSLYTLPFYADAEGYILEETLPEGASEVGEFVKIEGNIIYQYDNSNNNNELLVQPECIACIEGKWELTTLSTETERKFDEYLTNVWAKAEQYTWGETTTTNLTFSSGLDSSLTEVIKTTYNLAVSVSKSFSVAVTVPADPSKYSKLALYGDFNKRYVKGEYIRLGSVQKTQYGYSYEPTQDQYLEVVYQ